MTPHRFGPVIFFPPLDIIPIAKGIGGGFPIGAVLVNKKVASGMKPGTHDIKWWKKYDWSKSMGSHRKNGWVCI